MATSYWKGAAPAVAQVGTFQVTAYDAATTYALIIGSVSVTTIAAGSANATATALAAAWNASTHPYFAAVTASASTDTVTVTADTAGFPFTATSSETGGAGTIGDYVAVTASSGPYDWSTAANWSAGTVPVATNDIIIQGVSAPILFGLDQSSVALNSLRIHQSYTGRIGLPWGTFMQSASDTSESNSSLAREYRTDYLRIGAAYFDIGLHPKEEDNFGATRIKIDGGTTAATVNIHATARGGSETGLPAVRLKYVNSATDIFVRRAPGGVGIACDVPAEVSTVRKIAVCDQAEDTWVTTGLGTTITTWESDGGRNQLRAISAAITTVTIRGGNTETVGDFNVTTGNVYGGTLRANHRSTASGNLIFTTANVYGGTLDLGESNETRVITTLNRHGGTIKGAGTPVTFTTPNLNGRWQIAERV